MGEGLIGQVALQLALGPCSRMVIPLLEHFPRPEQVWNETPFSLAFRCAASPAACRFLQERSHWLEQGAREVDQCRNAGITLLPWSSSRYPSLLREIPAPPLVLYARGNVELLRKRCVAIVGTRRPSSGGLALAFRSARLAAVQELVVVSGAARGIDTAAHQGALEGGHTIAVLGGGVDYFYPRENRALLEQIATHGLILSEAPLSSRPFRTSFPQRNRIVSGLCPAVAVVQAPLRSGALITARLALEQGREVFAAPWPESRSQGRGCLRLLAEGAIPLVSGEELLVPYGIGTAAAQMRESFSPGKGGIRSPEEALLLQHMEFEKSRPETLAACCNLSLERTLALLVDLELRGLVRGWIGGGYSRLPLEGVIRDLPSTSTRMQ